MPILQDAQNGFAAALLPSRALMSRIREWIKSGRDEEAAEHIASGMSRAEVYARETHTRNNVQRVILENNRPSDEGADMSVFVF